MNTTKMTWTSTSHSKILAFMTMMSGVTDSKTGGGVNATTAVSQRPALKLLIIHNSLLFVII